MTYTVEQPKTEQVESSTKESVTTHPAFAQIGASRVSGSASLYDSDHRHQHYMTISIRRSQLNRGLNRDWHFGREELIEVALTESQWATFVSSPNMGSGVPCTIQRHNGQMVPQLPPPPSRKDQFDAEMLGRMNKMLEQAKGDKARIEAMNLPKGKTAELIGMVERQITEIQSNLPFVMAQFSEHMEKTTEKAKQEVHGYMTSVLQRAGLESLSSPDKMPLLIEGKED